MIPVCKLSVYCDTITTSLSGGVAMVTDLEKADRINVPSHLRAVDLCCNTAL